MKSFKEMTEEDQMARIKKVSDEIAGDAVSALVGYEIMEKLIREEGVKLPIKDHQRSRQRGKKTYVTMPSNPEMEEILGEMTKMWGISKSAIFRLGLWLLCYKYGWVENTNKILRNTDRQAICRDDRVPRPLVKRSVAKDKWEKTKSGIRNYGGDNAKRPPGLHGYRDQVPPSNNGEV